MPWRAWLEHQQGRNVRCSYICSPLHYDSGPPSLVLFGPEGPIYHRSLPYRKAIRVAYRLECRRRLDIVVTIAQYLLPALLPRKPTRRSPETTETGPGTHCIRYSPPRLPSQPCARVTSLSCGTARSEAEKATALEAGSAAYSAAAQAKVPKPCASSTASVWR